MISYAEFLAGASNKAALINNEQLRIAFDTMDLNGNGTVTVDELKWRFSSTNFCGSAELEGVDEDFWNRLIRNFDSDNDGMITFEAFSKEMHSLLERSTLSSEAQPVGEESKDQAETKNRRVKYHKNVLSTVEE